jgi:hypothetical protein
MVGYLASPRKTAISATGAVVTFDCSPGWTAL